MDIFNAVILGIVQGVTEVLPISSSGHLLLVPGILGWPESGLTFDVALHFGTFIALFIYFRNDVADMLKQGLTGFRQGHVHWLFSVSRPGAGGITIGNYNNSGAFPGAGPYRCGTVLFPSLSADCVWRRPA